LAQYQRLPVGMGGFGYFKIGVGEYMNKKVRVLCLVIAVAALAGCQSSDQSSGTQQTATVPQAVHSSHAAGEVVLQLNAQDPHVLTNVGQRTPGEGLVSNDKGGYLAFGPYAGLDSGRYTLTVFGKLQTPAPQNAVTVDVVYGQGKEQVAKVIFDRAAGEDNSHPILTKLDFELKQPVQDAEFRVLLAPGAHASMDGYTVVADQ
jgi:hypothetical protein